ncbi:MAG TPA: VWA domain-containing protein [Acidobacteriaceae bacterium]|nr:VWA domain-containing protein [Acidobacteriaceae bacterium]
MKGLLCWAFLPSLFAGAVSLAAAQTGGNSQPPQSGYTLHAKVREVITDVLVTDRNGNPIHGLSESAFHIFDNGKPQHLAVFEEHTQADASATLPGHAANVYSNDVIVHPPRVFNIILLDTATITVPDQMYLRQQLDHFIKQLPADEPFAVLARSTEHTIMLADFTTDHQRLLSAIHRQLPRILPPGSRYMTDGPLMAEICSYLQQYPGRKNVLWFNGGSNLALTPDPTTGLVALPDMRWLYDQLELARIALYPIDVRGLQVAPFPGETTQHFIMEDEADTTGGRLVFNNNGIADAARKIADTDASFYTLTYSPQDIKLDNKWHKVKVTVDGGGYQLSYRRGYFDDGSNLKQEQNPDRKRLLQNGEAVADAQLPPIVFDVRVNPVDQTQSAAVPAAGLSPAEPPKKGEHAFTMHYILPADALPEQTVGTEEKFTVGVGVLGFNEYGRSVARVTKKVILGVSQEHAAALQSGAKISFDQVVNLPDGNDSLFVVVWNTDTGRLGTVQIPLTVGKAHAD